MSHFSVAGLQLELNVAGGNFTLISGSIDHLMAVFPWVQMVVLSELAVHGPAIAFAETMPGPTERAFQDIAAKHGIWLVNGSAHERLDNDLFNTCSVIGPNGAVVARYRKMFPFRPYAVGVTAGTEFVVFDVPDVARFGVSICYDGWFPETSRTLACMGAEVILHPTMTPTTDRPIELALAVATAATNQVYFFDINGARGGGVGRSIVVGPEGDVIHQAGSGTEFIPIEIDLDRVRRSRERGLRGLGQPLKGFRDAPVTFDVYTPGSPLRAGLAGLGPLVKPDRKSPPLPRQKSRK